MASNPTPSCPRCGYDLSGAVESWTESCPLTGVCSECGLGFEWHDIVCAFRVVVRGFVEHAVGLWQGLGWAWITWLWTLWPPVFWRRVRAEDPPRPARIIAWLPVVAVPLLYLAALVHEALVLIRIAPFIRAPVPVWHDFASAASEPFARFELAITPAGLITGSKIVPLPWPWPFVFGATVSFAWPVFSAIFFLTRPRAKERMRQLLRPTAYGLSWLILPALVRLLNGIYLLLFGGVTGIKFWEMLDGPTRWMARANVGGWGFLWLCGVCAWIAWWWYCFLVNYLQLPNGRRVWALLLPLTLLPAAVLADVLGSWS